MAVVNYKKSLNAKQIAAKYNCSIENVRKWAQSNGVKKGLSFSGHVVFCFTRENEIQFANRNTSKGRTVYSKICIVQLSHQDTSSVFIFNSLQQAFTYTHRNGAFPRTLNVEKLQFKNLLKSLPDNDVFKINSITNNPCFSGWLFVWKPFENEPLYFFDKNNIPKADLIRVFFNYNQKKSFFFDQQKYESDDVFFSRILHSLDNKINITSDTLKQALKHENIIYY